MEHDPINKAMRIINCCSRLVKGKKGVIKKILSIQRSLELFLVKMLDLCDARSHKACEISTFLDKDDHLEGIFIGGSTLLPRISQALCLKLQNFVTHDYCQEYVHKTFYGQTWFKINRSSVLVRLLLILFQSILTPILCLCYFLCQLEILKADELPYCLNLKTPVNRMVSNGFVNVSFIVLTIVVLNNPIDYPCVLDPDPLYGVCLFMAVGQLIKNMEAMYQLALAADKANTLESSLDRLSIKINAFFSDFLQNCRFCGLSTFLLGSALKGAGYHFLPKYICLTHGHRKYKWVDDDASSYEKLGELHLVQFGNCLQGIAIIFIGSEILQFLRLHPAVSAIYEGLRKCLWDVFSYFFTYIFVTLTFAAGMYFVLHNSMGQCPGYNRMTASTINNSCLNVVNPINDTCPDNDLNTRYFIYQGTGVVATQKLENEIFNSTLDQTILTSSMDDLIKRYMKDDNSSVRDELQHLANEWETNKEKLDKMRNNIKECCREEFTSFYNTAKYLFLNVYDPGYHMSLDECTGGFSHVVGQAMWYSYFFIVSIVLVNLLIALMNTTLNGIESVDTWMYYRTLLWLQFCHSNVILPPPMNLFWSLISLPRRFLRLLRPPCCQIQEESSNSTVDLMEKLKLQTEYLKLMDDLVTRYARDARHASEDNVTAENDQLQHLTGEVEKTKDKLDKTQEKLDMILEKFASLDTRTT